MTIHVYMHEFIVLYLKAKQRNEVFLYEGDEARLQEISEEDQEILLRHLFSCKSFVNGKIY